MAQIRPYTSPIEGLRSGDQGAEAFASAGRRIGAFYRETGQELGGAVKEAGDVADRVEGHAEISHGGLASAATFDQLTQSSNEFFKNADPNDPTASQKWRDQVLEPALQKFQDGFITQEGQRFAADHTAGMRQHFYEKTEADQSNNAYRSTVNNFQKIGNTYAKTAYDDPTATKEILRQIDSSVGNIVGTSPNLTPEAASSIRDELAQKMKENVVTAAVQGFIAKNPNADYTKLTNDPELVPYLKAADPKQFQTYQQGQQRMQSAMDRQAEADARRKQTEAVDDKANKALGDSIGPDGKFRPTTDYFKTWNEIAHTPGANPSLVRSALELGEHMQSQQGKVTDDPLTVKGLQNALLDDNLSLEDLMRARRDDKISDETFGHIHGMMNDLQRDPTAAPDVKTVLDAAKSAISGTIPGMIGKDPTGEKNYSDFVSRLVPAIAKMSRDDRVKALNFKDPNSLVNQLMQPYLRTPQQKMDDLVTSYGKATEAGVTVPSTPQGDRFVAGQKVPPSLSNIPSGNLGWNGTGWQTRDGKKFDRNGDPIAGGNAITAPAVGTIKNGFRFKGGDPASRASWEPTAQPSAGAAGAYGNLR